MVGSRYRTSVLKFLAGVLFLSGTLFAQQNVPDAPVPKATQPNQFPENAPPAPKTAHAAAPAPATTATPSAPIPEGVVTDLKQFGTISVAVNFVQVPVT